MMKTQEKVFRFIREHIRDNGYAPSFAEIAESVGVTSSSTVHHHIEQLVFEGRLRRKLGAVRAISVVEKWRE